jgi:hypothetical protein
MMISERCLLNGYRLIASRPFDFACARSGPDLPPRDQSPACLQRSVHQLPPYFIRVYSGQIRIRQDAPGLLEESGPEGILVCE